MGSEPDRTERIAEVARGAGIECALIGAAALAFHQCVRATTDISLAIVLKNPYVELPRLQRALTKLGLKTSLSLPDDQDLLGGVLRVWSETTADGEPIEPIELVNYFNPHRAQPTPAADAIRRAVDVVDKRLRYVRLPDLIALKLYAGERSDLADVVELLKRNPTADREEIRSTSKRYQLHMIDELITEADA